MDQIGANTLNMLPNIIKILSRLLGPCAHSVSVCVCGPARCACQRCLAGCCSVFLEGADWTEFSARAGDSALPG